MLIIIRFIRSTKGFLLTLLAGLIIGGFYFGIGYMVEESDYNFKVGTLLNEADSYLINGLTEDAVILYNELLREVKEEESCAYIKKNLGICYHRLSEKEERAQNLTKAIISYEEAAKTYEQCGMYYSCAECFIYLGDVYWSLSEVEERDRNLNKALIAYDDAIQIYSANNYNCSIIEIKKESVSEILGNNK